MNFGEALEWAKLGKRIQRSGWNGKGMFVFLISNWTSGGGRICPNLPYPDYPTLPFLAMKTADNKVVPWLISQTDALAEDWGLYDEDDGTDDHSQR